MHELNQLKHKMDSVANEAKKKMETCEKLEDKMNELAMNATAPSTENDSSMRHIRVLENRLDKAMIKYNEAMSIRKTYEQIVKVEGGACGLRYAAGGNRAHPQGEGARLRRA